MITQTTQSNGRFLGPRTGRVGLVAGLVLGVVALILVVVAVILARGDAYSHLEVLPVEAYQRSPDNFLGNRYRLTGQIHALLMWEEGTGRLLAIRPEDSEGRIAIYVPDNLPVSLHTGQRYHMQVVVRRGGLLEVEDLRKY